MDSPPPNYNPNDSMLSGGTETIMKVMGGGSMPTGYNDTQSLLSGGIEPIVRVEGGGNGKEEPKADTKETDITIRYVTNYDFEDDDAQNIYKKFIETFGSDEKIERLNATYKREIEKIRDNNKPLHYITKPSFAMYNMPDVTKKSYTAIKFIPQTTREIIILPPVKNTEEFFKQILFLRDSHYLQVTKDKRFKLYNNIVVIKLPNKSTPTVAQPPEVAPTVSPTTGGALNELLLYNHLIYKLKKDNFNSFFGATSEGFNIIYPKSINDKNGILITKSSMKEFPQPKDPNDLDPIDTDLIIERKINSMIYESGEQKYGENEYFIISDSDSDPDIHNTNLSFGLNKYIAILELTNEETKTTIINLNGEFYKIRLASNQGDSDIVFNSWMKSKFTKHEKKLLDDIDLINMIENKHYDKENKETFINKDIADFLYYIGYYNCFNDVSLLTKKECMTVRSMLKDLYKYKLKHKHIKLQRQKGLREKDVRVRCKAVDIDSETIICDIIFREDGKRKIDSVSIAKPPGFNQNPEITEAIQQEAIKEWRKQNNPTE